MTNQKFTVEIQTNNVAFEENYAEAVAYCLEELAKRVREKESDFYPIRDVNGNRVGDAKKTVEY